MNACKIKNEKSCIEYYLNDDKSKTAIMMGIITHKLRFLYFHIIFVSLNYLVINKIKIQIIMVSLVFVPHFCSTSKFEGG